MVSKIKLFLYTFKVVKEVICMLFTQQTQLVKSSAMLILAEKITFDEVPNIFNLREQVALFLGLENFEG